MQRNLFVFWLVLIAALIGLFAAAPALAACPGCCSSHGGISNSCSSSGRVFCADGTVSPTCTCASCGVSVVPPPPTCSGGRVFSGGICVCPAGQTWASIDQICHSTASAGACGVERWSIKTASDPGAASVNTAPIATTIDALVSLQVPAGATTSATRVSPVEYSNYILDGTLTDYRLTEDSDYHLVLRSARGETMIVEAPHPDCVNPASPFLSQIVSVRAAIDAAIAPESSFKTSSIPIRPTGLGFFDEIHGQRGVAGNGIELHPLLEIAFNPSTPLSAPVANPYTGLWWIESESGWGMSLTQRGSIIFMAWYTYDPLGAPVWYVITNCPVVGTGCTGDIYKVTGGVSVNVPWNNPSLSVIKVGAGTFKFADADKGSFTYTLNGVAGVKNIIRQVFATGSTPPTTDYTSLWWNPNESGWGVSLTQQFGTIFAALYTYDANRNPIWYVATNCPVVNNSCTSPLYQVNGGRIPTDLWGPPALNIRPVGNTTFTFSDRSNGTMTFTINNVPNFKVITKQIF